MSASVIGRRESRDPGVGAHHAGATDGAASGDRGDDLHRRLRPESQVPAALEGVREGLWTGHEEV